MGSEMCIRDRPMIMIIPLAFLAVGAIFSGFAMVMTLAIPVRKIYGLESIITIGHLEKMAKIMLVTGSMQLAEIKTQHLQWELRLETLKCFVSSYVVF